ncbi:von willebrand factor A domain protein [Quillaja saponaria]|uniref:von willebrand factor A domain protein n=1 Tax=Quillaja saponaria TaxID=32244 RepID=A0AAD7Q4J6_QUISA|nr:von willebrand factor A domain protein [Quillaja saponaria]KAJ7974761.1 von willebrand factor A domain protein [Quillaja saponaria]
MDGGDGWNVAASGSSSGGVHLDKTIINQVMLRFRPIAPKPVNGGSVSGDLTPEKKNSPFLTGKRAKRKYVRVRRNSSSSRGTGARRKNIIRSFEKNSAETLQLMPEKTLRPESSLSGGSWCKNLDLTVEKIETENNQVRQIRLSDDGRNENLEQTVAISSRMGVVESSVTVESVTDTCMDIQGLGCTDVEKMKNLERDTCPGFISDGYNKVRWVNDAYKRMVLSGSLERKLPEIMVKLVVKENLVYHYPAFTCGVRLQYTWQKEKYTKMVPCDVWRLDCGGFAWKLDIKAALSLGL